MVGPPQIPCRELASVPSGAVNGDALAVPTSQAGLQREISAGGSGWGSTPPTPPHSTPCRTPWALATGSRGGVKVGGFNSLGAMAKPQLGPGEEGHVDARLQGDPSAVCSALDLEARSGSTGAAGLNLRSGLLLTGLHHVRPTSLPRAPSFPPVKTHFSKQPGAGPLLKAQEVPGFILMLRLPHPHPSPPPPVPILTWKPCQFCLSPPPFWSQI